MSIKQLRGCVFFLVWFFACVAGAENNLAIFNNNAEQNLFDASNTNQDFLAQEDAFRVSLVAQNSSKLILRFISAEGYYLYKEQFDFKITPEKITSESIEVKKIVLPQGVLKNDEFFGETEVYYGIIDAEIELNNPNNLNFNIAVKYQGCSEKGLCYLPQTINFSFGQENSNIGRMQDIASNELNPANKQSFSLKALLLFFIAGIGLAFTPCVLPMVPIISMVVMRSQTNIWRKFMLALAYVIPMALCFSTLGALMGFFGAELNLQARLQSAWVLVPFAGFFALMALAMFDLFELKLPKIIVSPLNKLSGNAQGGTLSGAVALGVLSSLLVSPCISAPLAAILVYISSTGDAQGGALNLLMLGLGMGVPLIIFSVGGDFLLPKAGNWLITVRYIFGILLLATVIWLLERIIPNSLILPLWALLAGFSAFMMLRHFSISSQAIKLVRIFCALLLLSYGAVALFGGYKGGSNPIRPWADNFYGSSWQNFTKAIELENALSQAAKSHRAVIIDWYANWCISCKVIERDILAHPAIAAQLDNYLLLRFDITDANQEQRNLLNKYNLFGPPAILFFDYEGNLLTELNIIGEISLAQFQTRLDQFAQILDNQVN